MIAERAAAVLFSEGELALSAYRLSCKAVCRSIYCLLPFKRPSGRSVHYIKTVYCISGNTMENDSIYKFAILKWKISRNEDMKGSKNHK